MIDIVWERIWFWKVLKEVDSHIYPSGKKRRKFLCRCKCWVEKEVLILTLRNWDSKSCWCYQKENPTIKHWLHNTYLYKVFSWIKSRCENPNDTWYKNYWGRWIKNEWNTFEQFYKDMWYTYKDWLTIDRIDNNWNYSRENCRWASKKEQSHNKRNNIVYDWKCLSEWSKELWIPYNTLLSRFRRYWWSIERTLWIE